MRLSYDKLVKRLKVPLAVIPAKAGIQYFGGSGLRLSPE